MSDFSRINGVYLLGEVFLISMHFFPLHLKRACSVSNMVVDAGGQGPACRENSIWGEFKQQELSMRIMTK